MAGIAEILLNTGYSVSGTDLKPNVLTEHLAGLGARIFVGHDAANVPAETTVCVFSTAVSEQNVEVCAARERNIPVIPRAEMLAELMRMKYGIAVGGAHGKTTTTTMVGRVLTEAGLDPTIIIGGRVQSQPSGAKLGTGQYLVAEADESDGSFCLLRPAVSVVTNIDREHLNHYGSFEKLERAFFQFMSAVPFYGTVVACLDDPVLERLSRQLKRRFVGYSVRGDAELSARDIAVDRVGSTFTLVHRGNELARVTIPIPGEHMVSNALAAAAVGLELSATPEQIAKALSNFPGVSRRSEVVGRHQDILVIDDYAHHPTEIRATLRGLRQAYLSEERRRLVVIFQPHRFSRTIDLFSEFLEAFDDADEVIVNDIYGAGEAPIVGVTGQKLCRELRHDHSFFIADPIESIDNVTAHLRSGDVVVTLGAGSIGNLGPILLRHLRSAEKAA